MTAGACVMSLLLLRRLLRSAPLSHCERRVFLQAAAFALLAAPVLSGAFADREHYFFLLALPWATVRLLRLPLQGRAGVAAAGLAALGSCIKPYNAMPLALLLLFGGPRDESVRAKVFSRATLAMLICDLASPGEAVSEARRRFRTAMSRGTAGLFA